jgi:hypothetical protein
MRLGLPENLERILSSTNLIENLFSRVREIGQRVGRWQSGTMVLRWTAAGVLEAERSFRKIAGYRAMPILVAALSAHDAKIDRAPTINRREIGRKRRRALLSPFALSATPRLLLSPDQDNYGVYDYMLQDLEHDGETLRDLQTPFVTVDERC